MRIKKAIEKLMALAAKSPGTHVRFKCSKPPKKKRLPKRLLSATLKQWAVKRCDKNGYFTFLEACRYYDRIGGSAGTSTVRHRLEQMGARNSSPGLAESHLRAKWVIGKTKDLPIREMIELDPTFKERYDEARRDAVRAGRLAPGLMEAVTFVKSHGKKGSCWVQVLDDDRGRQIRIQVKPRPGHTPTTN